MSEQPGGSTPNAFVFPPFAPPVFRAPAPPAPAAVAAPPEEPAMAPPEEPADDFVMEVPLPAHDVGDPDDLPQGTFDADEAQPWETPAPPVSEDLPWLEMPADGPRVHTSEAAATEPSWESILAPVDDESSPPQRFGEVADRLESIARALREDPDGFLAGNSADPLGLLVTGFVLGYSRR